MVEGAASPFRPGPAQGRPRRLGWVCRQALVIASILAPGPLSSDLKAQEGAREPETDTASNEVPATAPFLFYRPDIRFGSAAASGPLNILFNRGLSIMHFRDVERGLPDTEWGRGWTNVRDALIHPGAAIERRGGWGAWLRDEWVPTDLQIWSWAWAPNYAGHIVAGGITYRYLDEWAAAHGVPKPRLSAAVFLWGTMLLNEVIENQHISQGSAGTVADLLIFDPLGMLVFRIDGVASFFSETLRAADWSPIVAVTLPDLRVQNVSQSMAYKVPLPFVDRLRLLFFVGQGSQTGLTYEVGGGLSVSATVGFDGTRRVLDPVTLEERIEPEPAGGLFLDRDDSLLASLVFSRAAQDLLRANLYPGVLPGRLTALGLWLTVTEAHQLSLGIGTRRTLGLGFGFEANRR